jgi:hypothetical protein
MTKEKMQQVMRWIGFIQGVLFALRVYSLNELKGQNRKDPV